MQREDDVMTMKQAIVTGLSAAGLVLAGGLGWAAGQYGPGASDTEIKIGNTVPYSGPASAYGTIGKSEAAYFAMINDQGGINGRKVNFLSRDDSYSPPKTVEVVRKLVEEDQVLLMFGTLGTPPNTAIQGYLNDNKVPQLFVLLLPTVRPPSLLDPCGTTSRPISGPSLVHSALMLASSSSRFTFSGRALRSPESRIALS
jgi:Periplasmic binding protein